jgi:outer membrane receptor protein involved in Fe transport
MRALNSLLLSTISLAALTATPALAQAPAAAPADTIPEKTAQGEAIPPSSPPSNAQGQQAPAGGIVVTGSRIRRNNFSTPQNIDVITRDDQVLAGTRSTEEVLQSATVTSGTSQISGSFLGFISDNGQAASTVGLRGLGSQRTLILLNGRRLAPAGVGANLVAADLNVLPTSIVQRVEVLREGASSIYGSDAIAGVINVITDNSVDGITVDAFADHPFIGKGDTLRGSVTAGKTFDRGHITAAFEFRRADGLRVGDRKDFTCPRELAFIGGVEVGQNTPTSTTDLRCFPFERASTTIARGYGLYGYYFGAPYSDVFTTGRISFPGYAQGNPTLDGLPVVVNNPRLRPLASDTGLQTHFISPVKTYTAYLNGAYELGALGDAEIYGEGLFTRRKSHQDAATQLNFQSIDKHNAALTAGAYYGDGTPLTDFGFPATPFFPTAWANAGINYFGPFIEPDRTVQQKQKVDFWRANVGIRGSLGLGDWRYDGNVQLSRTNGRDDIQNPLTSRLTNSLNPVAAPTGTPGDFVVTGLPQQIGAGINYTCASNVTNGAYNGGTCVPINYFDPNIAFNGHLSDALFNYLYPELNLSKTKYKQNTFSLGVDGTLFALPGGDAKAALGIEHRYDHIDDEPGPARLSGDIYGFGTALPTVGSDTVNEAYAEVDLPILRDRPFVNLLELEASGRYTHYKSYGSGWTYHVNAQYAPVSAIRFRGNYGTNYRAPNLYEQFVADQIGFYPGSFDPCSQFAQGSSPGNAVYDNCLAELTPIFGAAGALNYLSTGAIQVTTKGGKGNIKAEHATTYGFGGVFTMPKSVADLTLAVDYWHINVKGEVGVLGNLILTFCYSATDFPTSPYCQFIGPRNTTGSHKGEISEFQNPYLNIARQISAGIDFDARYAARFLGGRFSTQLQATRNLKQELEQFAGQGLFDYNGTLGYPGNGSGPKWVGTLDTRFTTSNNITFRWGVKYVGPSDSSKLANPIFLNSQGHSCAAAPATCVPVDYDLHAEHYFEHGASVQFLWRNIGQFTLGVNNIFNEKPPTISEFPDQSGSYPRIGNYFANGPYDYRGRSIFANVTRSF